MCNEPDAFDLRIPGSSVEFTTRRKEVDRIGFGGLLVVYGYGDGFKPEYFAFDLACPYEVNPEVRVTMNALQAECLLCGSKFNVLHGTGVCAEGPAREG